MDALTPVFEALRLRPAVIHHLTLESSWGLQLNSVHGAGFHLVKEGSCWLSLADQPLTMRKSDLVVVTNNTGYALLSSPQAERLPVADLLKHGLARKSPDAGSSGDTQLLCGEFRTMRDTAYPLFSLLPPVIFIANHDGRTIDWLDAPLQMIDFELTHHHPGSDTVISHLLEILLIMVIRYWIFSQPAEKSGFFGALYHPQIGAALAALHSNPEHPWTVPEMAERVGMSRSSLASRFAELVGEPPMTYLTRWRMQLAAMLLTTEPSLSIEAIAQRIGYESAYAFSKAFKRWLGVAPSEYRRRAFAADDGSTL